MSEPTRNISLRVCLTYALFGLLWILATDWLAIWLPQNVHHVIVFEIVKGVLFIGISAALLAWYLRRQLKRQEETTAALSAANTELRQQRDLLDSFINSLPGVVYVVDPQRRLLRWNRRFEEVTGRTADELKILDAAQLFPASDAPILQAGMARALTEGTAMVEVNFLDREGRAAPYLFTGVRAMLDGKPCMAGVGIDIRARRQRDALLDGQKRLFEMIAAGAPLPETLDALLRLIESQSPDLLCSVLLLDDDGLHLRHGATPSLPESFNQAVDGLAIGPQAGSCGTAVFRREPVIVEDIVTDPLWEGGRELAAAHGLRACWSTPIFDAQQQVLGSFAIYYRTPARPNEQHLQLIEIATHTAAVAIGKQQQEAALRESELRHRLLGEIIVSFAFAYRVDPDHQLKLEWATSPIEEVIGYSEAELKSKVSFRSLIHPDDRAGQQAALNRVLAGHSEIMEFRLYTKSGQLRWLECYNRPEWSEDEQRIVRIYGASQDITARKRAEEALRHSEERYRLIVETAEEGIWMIDADNRTSFVNPKMAQMLGSTVSQMIGRSLFEFMDDEGREIASANIERRRQGIREQHEFKFLRADGTPLWAMLATTPIHGEAGRYLGALAMVSDITERRQAEENRKLSVSLLRATLESTADGLLVVDRAGKIVHFNQRFTQLWRIPETILASRDDQKALAFVTDQLVQPEDFFAKVSQLYDAPEADSFDMVWFKDGRVFERYSRPQWLDTRPVGRVWSFRDVTERKRAEEALRAASERLHLLSQRLIEIQESERRHLARELHDEIGQALTATKLNLEVLAREPEPARTKRVADSIAFVERLLQNVRNLSLNLRPPMLDDLGLVAALRWLLDQHARTTGRQVNFHHDLTDERFAPMIETTCFRVVQEALTNVTRHSSANNVHVELHRQPDGLTLLVRDDGRGFDVAEARRHAAHGNSLGLVGMEERVTLAGGRFSVTSSGNAGTELSAWFPLNVAVSVPTEDMA